MSLNKIIVQAIKEHFSIQMFIFMLQNTSEIVISLKSVGSPEFILIPDPYRSFALHAVFVNLWNRQAAIRVLGSEASVQNFQGRVDHYKFP